MTRSNLGQGCLLALTALIAVDARADENVLSLADLSIEDLADLQITSVSRVEESLRDAPAAVFVITAEHIRRSGVTSIPEALRLAPGVEVARRGADAWSVSIRGFNGDLANKLLVLIDGRSVYSPLYAGVFWDVQDTLLEDIERIEVIEGPGGTLWGANAVNGVINIITRSAKDTRGGFAEIGGGNEERGFSGFRYGGTLGNDVAARVYAKYLDRDSTQRLSGADGVDGMRIARSGFRLDWNSNPVSQITFQGDVYNGDEDGEFRGDFTLGTLPGASTRGVIDLAGGNLLGRWKRQLDEGSDLTVQVYYDYTRRDIPNTYAEKRDTFDVDFQHHFSLGDRNDVLWGAGFRSTSDELDNSLFATFDPADRTDQTLSAFFQDRIALSQKRLFLTLGSKLEDNDYTGSEVQPNARLTWLVSDRQTFWSAVSRAVRVPSRLEADLRLMAPLSIPGIPFPVYISINGNHDFDSEKLLAYEVGYRIQAGDDLSFDLAVFRNDYDDLQTTEARMPILALVPPLPYAILPNVLDNGMEGKSSGGTFAAIWQPVPKWRLRFQYAYFDLELINKPGSLDTNSAKAAGNSPKQQLSIYAFADLPYDLIFYGGARYVDELPNQGIEDYAAVDVSLRWSRNRMFASLTLQNLNDAGHREFGGSNQVERSAVARVAWSF